MNHLINKDSNEIISNHLDVKIHSDINVVLQTSLDGTEYLTRFGSPVKNYIVDVWINETQKNLLENAFAELAMIEAKVRRGIFSGRIKAMDDFEKITNGWYKTTVTLSKDSEVLSR